MEVDATQKLMRDLDELRIEPLPYATANIDEKSEISQESIKKDNFIEENRKSTSVNKELYDNKNSRNWSNIDPDKPESRNGTSRDVNTPSKPQGLNNIAVTQKTNPTSLQISRQEAEKISKESTEKNQVAKRTTQLETPKNKAYQVTQATYPQNGIYGEVHHFGNKDQHQNMINPNKPKMIYPYDSSYDVTRTENPFNYRIECTSKVKSLENHNRGLLNIGSTCYMNSVLQILASTEGFDCIISRIWCPFFTYLANVLKLMKSKSGNLSHAISQFKDELGSEFSCFQGDSLNDPKELFHIIVSKLADENPSFDLFSIKKKIKILCSGHEAGSPDENSSFLVVPTGMAKSMQDNFLCSGHEVHSYDEKSSFFVVNTRKARSIQDYISGLKSVEYFTGKNRLYCDRCGCLGDMMAESKDIEISANLAFYLASALESVNFTIEDNILIENSNYVLYGVICHIGSSFFGHFFAYAYCESESSWVEYNDERVTFADKPNFRNAYMLFYKNKN